MTAAVHRFKDLKLLVDRTARGDELRLQRLVWMCDVNLSAIAEFNAIFVSTLALLVICFGIMKPQLVSNLYN